MHEGKERTLHRMRKKFRRKRNDKYAREGTSNRNNTFLKSTERAMLRPHSKDSFVGFLLRASPALLLCKQGEGGGGRGGDQSLENYQEVGVDEHGFCVSTCVTNINKCTMR